VVNKGVGVFSDQPRVGKTNLTGNFSETVSHRMAFHFLNFQRLLLRLVDTCQART
jgi:hypothetical protein